ncbi:zinc finger protein 62 homolog [Littorina saxatilis]|uniref:zinc finger protein 62 homolog n=1 Tax=Littorina saxatilis TaxID=31220 RepID=UPI0038B46F69
MASVPIAQTASVSNQAANTLITVSIPQTLCTNDNPGSSIVNVTAGGSIGNQVNNLVTTVMALEGFSLADHGLDKVQEGQAQRAPKLDDRVDSGDIADDYDDGVNLVVKATFWWCKDCNVKQKFGCGESMEEHLRLKHGINGRPGGTKDSNMSVMCSPVAESCSYQAPTQEITSDSDLVTSVYSIPADSVTVEDQTVDTLILIDDITTLQVVATLPEEKILQPECLKSSAGNMSYTDQGLSSEKSKGPASFEALEFSHSTRHSNKGMLPDLKPIPVIPALPCDKTPLCSGLPRPGTVTVRSKLHPSRQSSSSILVEPETTSPGAAAEPSLGTRLCEKSSNSKTTASKAAEVSHETRQVTTKRQRTLQSAKKVNQGCSVGVEKLSTRENKYGQTEMKPNRKRAAQRDVQMVSRTESLAARKSTHDTGLSSADSGSRSRMTTRSRSGLSRTRPVKHHKKLAKKAKMADDGCESKSKQNTRKEVTSSCHSKVNSRSSSGRKIKKPLRYLDGSEMEEEEDEGEESEHGRSVSAAAQKKKVHPRSKTVDEDFSPVKKKAPAGQITTTEHHTEEETDVLAPLTPEQKSKEEKVYTCEDCGRKFKFESKLKKHAAFYTGQMMQQCSVCDVSLHNLDLLNVHMYHVHKTNEPTSCLTCGKTLGSKKNLLHHLLTHPHSKGQNVANLIKDSCATHMCSICHETVIEGDGRVESHYLAHKKPNICTCQTCGKWFSHKADLYHHLKEHGDSDKSDLQSVGHEKSKQTTASKGSALVHGQKESEKDIESQPVQSIIAASVEQILKFEENSMEGAPNQITVTFISSPIEESETPASVIKKRNLSAISCQKCGKFFKTKKLLYQHLRCHGTVDTDTSCKDNSIKTEVQKEQVRNPIDLARGVPFGIPCTVVNTEGLEGIVRTFTTTPEGLVVPSQMQVSCALCERQFESEVQARRHVNRFMEQRTILQCNQCSLKFHNLDLFNVHHTYLHQPEGSSTCMTCNADFKSKADFFAHLGNSPGPHPLSHRLGLKTFLQDACGRVTCSTCGKSMWNYPMNIANHTKTHKSYPCPICQLGFPYKYALLTHLQAHTNSRNLSLVSARSELHVEQSELTEIVNNVEQSELTEIVNNVEQIESSAFVENPDNKFCCSLCDAEITCQRKNIHKHLDLHARKVLTAVRDGKYFCHECGQDIVVTEQSVADHMNTHGHTTAEFVCVFCTRAFEAFEDFKEHEARKHWLNVYFEKSVCEVCGKGLVSRQELKKHVKLHGETQGLFTCPRCKQAFRFESKLKDHLAKHASGQGSYACQFCGKLYMTKISLHRHEQVDHMGIKDFKHKCPHCDAQFINATHLRDHVTNKHSDGASYTCSECGLGFRHLSTCVRHKRVVHGGDTPYVCKECGDKFPVKRMLELHVMSHTGVHPFQCSTCLKSFSVQRTLQEHVDFVHRGIVKFQCHGCSSKFPRKRNLVRHMSTCRLIRT